MMNNFSAIATLAAALVLSSRVYADDWPVARGDQSGTGVAASALPDAPELLWKYESSETAFEATPVVESGVAYLGDANGGFHAVNLADGARKWLVAFEDSGFMAAAAVCGERVVCADYNGVVRCLSANAGEQLWEHNVESEAYAGPIFYNNNVLVCTESGKLFGLKNDSGGQAWEPFTIEAPLRCSPTIAGGRILLAGCDAKLHAVAAATGKKVASVDINAATGNTVATHNGRSFFGTEDGAFIAVDSSGDLKTAWTYADPQRGQGIRTAAAVNDKAAVFASQGKALYAVNPTDGKLLWWQPTRSRVEGSPVIAGERVVVGTSRGRLMLLDLASGEEVWKFEAGGAFLSGGAVVDGKLLIANDDGVLYCFGRK